MKRGWMVLTVAGAMAMGSMAMAQEQGQGPGNQQERRQREPGQMRQRMNPEQMRQQRMDRLKQQLGVNDEEWGVLQPVVDKIFAAQRDANTWGGWAGRGGQGAQRQGAQQETELQKASRELRSAVQDDANESVIQERLATYRAAREKAQSDLNEARKELQELVTPKQEAVLVVNGVLE